MKLAVFVCGTLLGLSSLANAAVIYDNGPLNYYGGAPRDYGGSEVTSWTQAEDFTLANDSAVSGGGLYIAGFTGIDSWSGSISYSIFSNGGSRPDTVVASGAAQNITATDTGIGWYNGGNIFMVAFDLETAFDALADETYWLAINLGDGFTRNNIYWIHAEPNDTHLGHERPGDSNGSWSANVSSAEHAFYLRGAATQVEIPAPAALLIFSLGLIGIASRRRV